MEHARLKHGDVCDGCLARPEIETLMFRVHGFAHTSEPCILTEPGQSCDLCGQPSRILTSATWVPEPETNESTALQLFEAWSDKFLKEMEGV